MSFILNYKYAVLICFTCILLPKVTQAQYNLDSARHFLEKKEYSKAEDHANTHLKNILLPADEAEALLIKGNSMIRRGEVFQSLEVLQKSSTLIKKTVGHDSIRFMINYYLGYVYTKMYDKRAIPILEECYKDITNGKQLDSIFIFAIINDLGRAHLYQGEYHQAQPYNIMAEEIALHLNDSVRISTVYNNMAIVSSQLFDDEGAIAKYELSKNYISKSVADYDYKLKKYLLNVSSLYIRMGRLQEAETFIRQGISLGADQASSVMTKLYSNLSDVYERQGLYEKGLEYIRVAHQFGMESLGPEHPVTNQQKLKLSQLAYRNKKHAEALAGFQQALDNFSNSFGETHPFVGAIQVSMAKVQLQLGELHHAEELLLSAAQKISNSSDPQIYTDYGHTKINLAIANKNWLSALSEIDTAYSKLNYRERGNFNNTILQVDLLEFISQEAEIYLLMGGSANELRSLELSKEFTQLADHFIINDSDAKNKYLLFQNHYNVYERGIKICSELSRKNPKYLEDVFYFIEKSKANLLGASINDFDNSIFSDHEYHIQKQKLIREIKYLENQVYEIYQRGDSEKLKIVPSIDDSIFAYKSDLYSLNRKIEEEFPDYFQNRYHSKITSLKKIQDALDSNTAILEYFYGDETVYILLVASDTQKLISLDLNSVASDVRQLNTLLNSTSNHSPKKKDWPLITKSLSKQILMPVLKELDNSINSLIIIPDGPLASIPFAILPTKTNDFLIKDYSISYNNSSSIWHSDINTGQRKEGHLIAFAPTYNLEIDPSQDNHLAFLVREGNYNLPGATEEVGILNDKLGGNVFMGEDATKTNFLSQEMSNNIIHLAMHSLINAHHPQFNRLVFSPRKNTSYNLYASEILNMKIDAQMAVLSACNSGAGLYQRGEGPQSLGNAFRFAGVNATAMSLWKVPDHSTKSIMTSLYEHLQKGERKDQALRLSMIDYLDSVNEIEMKHPKYWSSFLIYGNMDPIHFEKSKFPTSWIIISTIILFFLIYLRLKGRRKLMVS